MKCKDCIHNNVCHYKETVYNLDAWIIDFGCNDFKNKDDVVGIVRCKDCENKAGEINQCDDVYCSLHQGYFDKDAFCSYGERRKEDGDK